MNIVWSQDAIDMADTFLEESLFIFGQNTYKKNLARIDILQQQLSQMPRLGSLEPALADEDGEYRFRLINKRFKLVYRILDDETILIFAVWDMLQDPSKLRLFI